MKTSSCATSVSQKQNAPWGPKGLVLAFACVCPGSPPVLAFACMFCGHIHSRGGQDVEVEEAWALSLGLCCDWESQAAPSTNKQ